MSSAHRLTLLTFGLLLLTLIDAPYPGEKWLQHVPTVAILLALNPIIRRRCLSDASIACILAFLWLHILGARWIDSCVPYDQWSQTICVVRNARQELVPRSLDLP